uniref:Uncharacterized protein n=1 Tax=Eutreptiella gymnastica TaxID=73025 RepID=A0A6U7U4V2_9EUGL
MQLYCMPLTQPDPFKISNRCKLQSTLRIKPILHQKRCVLGKGPLWDMGELSPAGVEHPSNLLHGSAALNISSWCPPTPIQNGQTDSPPPLPHRGITYKDEGIAREWG